ncbi:MAG: CmcI family methyltransferase [Actinomycetota bacterium]
MFPLWEAAIAPVLAATKAKRVVEIGALRGDTTKLMLDFLGPEAELHVIDPAPDFDPTEHERTFAGRYHFHRDLSHNVLPHLEPMDAALIDGDHNWYTVYHELSMLAKVARDAGRPLPVLILHDVCWPYGRRDLYYSPDQIPDEFRQPWARAGMRPDVKGLLPKSGVNPTMCNAEMEGGPRNGVMTALDDFIAEHDRPVRRLLIPIYFGLAIVAEEGVLAERPDLAAALDRIEGQDGQRELLEVAEETRIRALVFQHTSIQASQRKLARTASRYLELLKGSLLNEHYLENEIRLRYLARCLSNDEAVEPDRVRDPVRFQPDVYNRLRRRRRDGLTMPLDGANGFLPYTAMGRTRLDHLEQCLDSIRADGVPGDLIECGTGRGGGAIFLRGYLAAHELPDRKVWVADRFRASPAPAREARVVDESMSDLKADLNLVRDAFERFDLLDDRVRFLQGPIDDTVPKAAVEQIALLRIGPEGGSAAGAVLEALYPKLSVGGFVVIDEYADPSCAAAVTAFRVDHGISAPLEPVDWSAVGWQKTEQVDPVPAHQSLARSASLGLPLAPPPPIDSIDLTVVVVFYNMKREAERTLRSLSRPYQLDLEDVTYEVIAVENGSDDDQKLGADYVASFGPEFRYLDLGDDARPSPAHALNRGIAEGRGKAFALMIDGAHVLTPSVLKFGLAGLKTYEPAIVATQQWYLGPGQQGEAMSDGYDQAYEDRLFKQIGWPEAGYRLFEIGHFVGGRDWLDGVWESNCMFVPRRQLEQVGGFDESFSMPGGGFANLELYERLGSSPDVTVATIIGEGSFHQVHGGVTTNQPEADERRARVFGYGEHFAELRGRRFRGPGKPIHYVGRIASPDARRSRPRRLTGEMFGRGADAPDPDGLPATPLPVTEDLRVGFVEAVWRSLAWNTTTWLGRHLTSAPTDLIAYQQLIASVRPDWIIETGTADGGRTLFLASICELLDHGQVVSIDSGISEGVPLHPRIVYVDGVPDAETTVARVNEIVGSNPRGLVVLGGCRARDVTQREFAAYAPLVAVDSYAIVTDTIVNGNPVWTGFGPGPAEAVKQILLRHGEFYPDPSAEQWALTFNPGGFLKRSRSASPA